MDYILRHIESKIRRFEGKSEAKIYYQVKVEYSYFLLLSYFWNKNFQEIGITDFVMQGNIIKEIQRPSIGTIWSLIQKLDLEKELSKSKNVDEQNYANIRNELIGHGYSFEDDLQAFVSNFQEQYQNLLNLRLQILSRKNDLILVQDLNKDTNQYTGTIYDADGDIGGNWKCPKEVYEFEINNLYASCEPNIYFRLSPFIHIDSNDDSMYVYRQVEQPLLGRIRYNRIDKSDRNYTKDWNEFEFVADNGIQRKSENGSIINNFAPNYKKFIDIGSIKQKIYNFLIGNEKGHSVCITLWGHGGNGKTATAQKICEELAHHRDRPFEFIVFLSAKDRELNRYTGQINLISAENRVTSFEDLIEKISMAIFSEVREDLIEKIKKEKPKTLIVIDDFETFEDVDKEKIKSFIKNFNPDYLKFIVTTRYNFLIISEAIQTNELDDAEDTKKFLLEVLKNEHNYTPLQLANIELELKKNGTFKEVHNLTFGKPIDIIRFANCFVQKGKLNDDFLYTVKKLNSRSERIEFLHGRNYTQLKGDKDAQDIFVVIGLLTPIDSLTSLVKHIKLILNKSDEDETKFTMAIDKLAKLRLIDIDEDGTYKVDSKDILEIMKKEYDKRDSSFKGGTKAIYDRIKTNITSDTDKAMLSHVQKLRFQSNAETTIQQYREIIRQGKDFSVNIKTEALLDLADFYFNHRGEKENAVRLFDEFFDEFDTFEVLKRYASYCWSTNKGKAIKILEDFYAKKGATLTKSQKGHILALIVMRESQFWSDKFEREYYNRNKIKQEFSRIFKFYGHFLFDTYVKKVNFYSDYTSEQKKDIIDAIDDLTDICYRIDNKEYAQKICVFAIDNFRDGQSYKFKKKFEKIKGYRSYSQPSQPQNKTTEFGGIVLNALSKKLEIINLEIKDKGYTGTILSKHTDSFNSKYGYISVDGLNGKVKFKEFNLSDLKFDSLLEGSKVNFGFDKLQHDKYGAINITLVK